MPGIYCGLVASMTSLPFHIWPINDNSSEKSNNGAVPPFSRLYLSCNFTILLRVSNRCLWWALLNGSNGLWITSLWSFGNWIAICNKTNWKNNFNYFCDHEKAWYIILTTDLKDLVRQADRIGTHEELFKYTKHIVDGSPRRVHHVWLVPPIVPQFILQRGLN